VGDVQLVAPLKGVLLWVPLRGCVRVLLVLHRGDVNLRAKDTLKAAPNALTAHNMGMPVHSEQV
jgi:hypothetical protein